MLMKKTLTLILAIVLVLTMPVCAFANSNNVVVSSQAPVLNSISFKNADIQGVFDPYVYEYGITLADPSVTPTLDDYEINGDANIFVTYKTDLAGRQTGVIATLKFANGTVTYTFNYLNTASSTVNSNNNLAMVACELCEVYPALNQTDTKYTLYIPNDLTEINLSVATEDVGAHCSVPGTITIGDEKELDIPLTVIASDSTAKSYTFSVKRLDKTCQEVRDEMAQDDFTSLVEKQLTVQKTETAIIAGCAVGGLILLAILIKVVKRLTVKVSDSDESEFFEILATEQEESDEK